MCSALTQVLTAWDWSGMASGELTHPSHRHCQHGGSMPSSSLWGTATGEERERAVKQRTQGTPAQLPFSQMPPSSFHSPGTSETKHTFLGAELYFRRRLLP